MLIDIRGVNGGDGLSRRSRDKFVIDEKTSGLLVAVPVGGNDIHGESHLQLCQWKNKNQRDDQVIRSYINRDSPSRYMEGSIIELCIVGQVGLSLMSASSSCFRGNQNGS